MRKIAVITVGRSDYGIYLPILTRIQNDPDLQLNLIVSGMHLSPEFGLTVDSIENDGFQITEKVEMLLATDSPQGISKSMGMGLIGFSQTYQRIRPDIILVLGDRFEMHAAVLAALPFKIPIAHLHGGEITQGAIDDSLRHSITKLSHLHFVSTPEYAQRVIQLGEEPWRVTVSGAPGLDNLQETALLSCVELNQKFGIRFSDDPLLLVTYHPVTLEYEQVEYQVSELLAALRESGLPVLFTLPNADTGGRQITQMINDFVAIHPSSRLVENLGTQGYFSVLAQAAAMVGNSSSGIIEAASFALPVVNIGTRQKGRLRGENVIDVDYDRESIFMGLEKALSNKFVTKISGLKNLYGDGNASKRIVEKLKLIDLDEKLIVKKFFDQPRSSIEL